MTVIIDKPESAIARMQQTLVQLKLLPAGGFKPGVLDAPTKAALDSFYGTLASRSRKGSPNNVSTIDALHNIETDLGYALAELQRTTGVNPVTQLIQGNSIPIGGSTTQTSGNTVGTDPAVGPVNVNPAVAQALAAKPGMSPVVLLGLAGLAFWWFNKNK